MSCDSQVHMELQIGDEVVIEKYATPLRLLYPLATVLSLVAVNWIGVAVWVASV